MEDVEETGALPKPSASVTPASSEVIEEACTTTDEQHFPLEGQSSGDKGGETSPESPAGSSAERVGNSGSVEVTSVGEEHSGNVTSNLSESGMDNNESASITDATAEPKQITYPQIVKEGRRFNIDLTSKVGNSLTFLSLLKKIYLLH